MTMIFLAPNNFTALAAIKRVGRPLLALPLCLLLISCDSASSNTNDGMVTQTTPAESLNNAELQDSGTGLQDRPSADSSDELDDNTKGQSLIAAAQSSNDGRSEQSLSDTSSDSNALQATLMGDYGGMVACDSCDSLSVTLNLFSDGSVIKTSIYNNAAQPHVPLLESGIYRQDNDKITIVYESEKIETYHIQDNHLILLDEEKNLNNDYTLSRK